MLFFDRFFDSCSGIFVTLNQTKQLYLAMELFSSRSNNMIIVGDLNCDFNSTSPCLTRLGEIMNLFNLNQIVSEATRTTSNSSSLIDVILTNNLTIHSDCRVIPCAISDHDFIYTSLKFKIARQSHVEKSFRNFKNFDCQDFLSDLDEVNWSILEDVNDPEIAWNIWYYLFNSICDKHVPFVTRRFKSNLPKWLEHRTDIFHLMHERDIAKSKAKRTKIQEDWDRA